MQNVAKELRMYRKLYGYTLAQLADQTGLSVSFLSDMERGRTEPSISTLRRIAAAYGREMIVAFVLRGQDEDNPIDSGQSGID